MLAQASVWHFCSRANPWFIEECRFPIIECVPAVVAHWAVVARELLVRRTAGFACGTTSPRLCFYYTY